MVLVVDSIFIASNSPKALESLAGEVRKTIHHAFEDENSLNRFIGGIESSVKALNLRRSVPLSVFHTRFDEGGSLNIRRSDVDGNDYIRLHYFRLVGHIHVSQDGLTVYQQEFIEEVHHDV